MGKSEKLLNNLSEGSPKSSGHSRVALGSAAAPDPLIRMDRECAKGFGLVRFGLVWFWFALVWICHLIERKRFVLALFARQRLSAWHIKPHAA